jgi:hypothetical protein
MTGVTRITKEIRRAVKILVLLECERGGNVFMFRCPLGEEIPGGAPLRGRRRRKNPEPLAVA